jgi:hypothetical protein
VQRAEHIARARSPNSTTISAVRGRSIMAAILHPKTVGRADEYFDDYRSVYRFLDPTARRRQVGVDAVPKANGSPLWLLERYHPTIPVS